MVPLVRQAVWRHNENLLYHQWRTGTFTSRHTCIFLSNIWLSCCLFFCQKTGNYTANTETLRHSRLHVVFVHFFTAAALACVYSIINVSGRARER